MTKRRRVTYDQNAFFQAISAYRHNAMSSVEASRKFGVPESTIRKHKHSTSNHVGSGRPRLLSSEQEQYLVALLIELESIGVRLTKEVLSKITGDFVRTVKKDGENIKNPGRRWFHCFFKRNGEKVKMKKEIKLENARRINFTEEVRQGWFRQLKNILDSNNLHTRPAQIWNCDESGFSDETQCEYVCVSAETKFAFEQNGGTGKAFTTMLLCTNACGESIPPLVVYAAKSVNPLWCNGGVPETTFSCSDSGWISEQIFTDWFKNCFIERTKHIDRPLLLVMDNHPTHISIDVIELALANKIILLCLPPHSTHALQPLDVVTFNSAKKVWKKTVSKYFSRTGRKTIRKIDFPSLLKSLMDEAFTKRQCVSGFARCGLWPFDDGVMKEKVAKKDHHYTSSTSSLTNLHEAIQSSTPLTTSTGQQIDQSFGGNASITTSSNSSSIETHNKQQEELVAQPRFFQNETSISYKEMTSIASTSMTNTAEIAMLNSSCNQISKPNHSLSYTTSSAEDENQVWPNSDGAWTSRITTQVILPTNDIEEMQTNNDQVRMDTTNSSNAFIDQNDGFNSYNTHQLNNEPTKTFHDLTNIPIQISPSTTASAVRSIVMSCLLEMPPAPPAVNKRVRQERRFGEEITTGGLLQELKEKKAAKEAKSKRPKRTRKAKQNS